jgi:hypothetical protein
MISELDTLPLFLESVHMLSKSDITFVPTWCSRQERKWVINHKPSFTDYKAYSFSFLKMGRPQASASK